MKNNTGFPRTIASGFTLAVVLVAGILAWGNGPETSRGEEPIVLGFDMNTAGNECPADGTNCSIGPIDACVSLNPGDSFQFDNFMQGLPEGEALSAWDTKILWGPPDWLDINERTHSSTSVNLLVQIPGSDVLDLSPQDLPVVSSPHITAVVDMALPIGRHDEANPPYTQGVLGRYRGQVAADVEPGLYALTFDFTYLSLSNTTPQNLCELYGCEALDGNHAPQYGLVAVGEDCPAGPTMPGPGAQTSPTATAAPTETTAAAPTGSPAVTPTPVPATTPPGPAGATTPATALSDDDDGTDWGSPVLIVVYVIAGLVGGLAVASIAYLGTRGRRA